MELDSFPELLIIRTLVLLGEGEKKKKRRKGISKQCRSTDLQVKYLF